MKNLQIYFCLVCMFFVAGSIQAQNDRRNHSVGLQLNPYLDSHFLTGTFIKPVFAMRYGYKLNNHISLGPEVSGYLMRWDVNKGDMNITDLNLGGFVRYSFMPTSRIRPFLELSPYYTLYHFKSKTIVTQEGIGMEYNSNYFSGYLSPGITLFSKNQKFSLDLMYKFSNKRFVNGNQSAFTYRLNFNF